MKNNTQYRVIRRQYFCQEDHISKDVFEVEKKPGNEEGRSENWIDCRSFESLDCAIKYLQHLKEKKDRTWEVVHEEEF